MPDCLRRRPALGLTLLGLAAIACYSAAGCRPATTSAQRGAPPVAAEVEEDMDDGGGGWKLPPNDRPNRWEFDHRMTSFVTDRPDLSAPPSTERDTAVEGRISPYFTSAGLRKSDARDLLVALDAAALLMRFRLPAPELERFLKGKRKVNGSAVNLDGFADDLSDEEAAGLLQLHQYPFVRLDWWPIAEERLDQLAVYEGKIRWGHGNVPARGRYYVYVDPAQGLVYVLGR